MSDDALREILARLDAQESELATLRTARMRQRARTWLTGPRTRGRTVALALLALLIALVPLSILAANPFTDLDPAQANGHNPNIDTIYNLGITTGCTPTEYCPKDAVTREQMASFLARTVGLGRMAFTSFPVADATADLGAGPSKDYMTVNLAVPGRTGQSVYVRVSFTGYAFAKSAAVGIITPGCPCLLRGELRADSAAPQIVTRTAVSTAPTDIVGDPAATPAVVAADRRDFSGSAVFLVPAGAHTFTMSVTREVGTATNVGFAFGNMQAEIAPLGGAGGVIAPLTATLSGANEVNGAGAPNQGDPDGTGSATVTVNPTTGEICYTVGNTNLSPTTGAHIHRGAAGTNGPIVVNFTIPAAGGSTTGCTSATVALAQEIDTNPTGFYVNVHSTEFGSGAIRGQLGR